MTRASVARGTDMTLLLEPVEPAADESAAGYLIRALARNGSSIREVLEHVYGASRRVLCYEAAPELASVIGVPVAWLQHRLPLLYRRDRWQEIQLFGANWRDDWTLRGAHQQFCPVCFSERGTARLEWDLAAYAACHIHGVVLQDHCGACGRAVSVDRPALDLCSCGHFLGGKEAVAHASAIAWSRWLARAIHDAAGEAMAPTGNAALNLLHGLSPDGGVRVLLAFGGGSPALRGEVLNGASPWLTSRQMHDIQVKALDVMNDRISGKRVLGLDYGRCADALAEQQVRGISSFDRAQAAALAKTLGHRPRWRNRSPTMHEQLQLDLGYGANFDHV